MDCLGVVPASARREASRERSRLCLRPPWQLLPRLLTWVNNQNHGDLLSLSLLIPERKNKHLENLRKHPEASLGSGMTSWEPSHHRYNSHHVPVHTPTCPCIPRDLNLVHPNTKTFFSDPAIFPTRQPEAQRLGEKGKRGALRGPWIWNLAWLELKVCVEDL